jgi:hypothetical protein
MHQTCKGDAVDLLLSQAHERYQNSCESTLATEHLQRGGKLEEAPLYHQHLLMKILAWNTQQKPEMQADYVTMLEFGAEVDK